MKQSELVKKLTDRELLINVYATQLLLFVVGLILLFFLFSDWMNIFSYFRFELNNILLFGIGSAIFIIVLDLTLMKIVPEEWLNDGGINKRVFQNLPFWHILLLALLISIVEEFVFRGVLQTKFGLIFASVIFAILHIRYLYKPLLFGLVVSLSFFIGYIFLITQNLYVTITTHFIVDFTLGLLIRYRHIKM
jgi:uncharacterized protein